MMKPALTIGGISFYDAPSEIEGSPYWVDLWTDINGYKIGLQIKPQTYKSASISVYMGKSRTSEERGHKAFQRDFGGRVFIVMPVDGGVSEDVIKAILTEKDRLLQMKHK